MAKIKKPQDKLTRYDKDLPCKVCGKKTLDFVYQDICHRCKAAKMTAYSRARKQRLRDAGLCYRCGKHKARTKGGLCQDCSDELKFAYACLSYEKWMKENGIESM